MELINTQWLIHGNSPLSSLSETKKTESTELVPSDNDLTFEDPDSARDYWVTLDIFEPNSRFKTEDLVKQMLKANAVQLNLKKQSNPPFSVNLMKQHSIQISLFDALVLTEHFTKRTIGNWKLELTESLPKTAEFKLNKNDNLTLVMHDRIKQTLKLNKNNQPVGRLRIDVEKQVIEKIHGTIHNQPFIIDPVWKHSQTTIDAVKINLGGFHTEIVHHPKHKRTLWRGKKARLMAITQNKTYQINYNLFVNKKVLEWPSIRFESVQWYCPWQRLAIAGQFAVIRTR